ncbi:MAG: type II toxin-antitoxin system prevent-host-death family antitoxin [Chloroflexota bacterium]
MAQMTVGIRELKARLSSYLRQVKAGSTLVITERGKPVGRLVPLKPSVEAQLEELRQAGLVAWSGRKLEPGPLVSHPQGDKTIAELLLEDRE